MKWILAAAAFASAATLYVATGSDAPDPAMSARRSAGPRAGPTPPPLLRASGARGPAAAAQDGAPTPAPREPGQAPERGGGFTPIEAPELPAEAEHEDAAERTRGRLQALKPLRSTWSDAPLPDVLEQLSKQAGVVVKLHRGAIERGKAIRVSDPWNGAEAPAAPSVWDVVEALAAAHGFRLAVGGRGVYLLPEPDPAQVRLRYYDVKDLVAAEWGRAEDIEEADRLGAVFADMVREAAGLAAESTVEMRNGIVIARASSAALGRVGRALDGWRAAPERLREAWRVLVATRHPTVSGAPPRAGR